MTALVVRRLLTLGALLVGISFISFLLMHLSPSDPALMMLSAQGIAPTPDLLEQTRHDMGLDQPFFTQYINWLQGIFQGYWGYSYVYSAPVADVLLQRLPVTLTLSFAALLLTLGVALPAGVTAALHPTKLSVLLIRLFELTSLSMPTFWFGLLLIYLFALTLGWFPAVSDASSAVGYLLPVVALSFSYVGRLIGQIRADVTAEVAKPYVEGLISRGMDTRRIIWRHVLRNALLPSLTVAGLALGAMLSGSITTEMVFNLPGLGFASIEAITARDYALVQGYVLVSALFFVMVNLFVDIIYRIADPRIRLEPSERRAFR
ncbi:ABC transporter permease [Cryptobacterium curtum]|uniref:ABC transporter permease n=1 Tax=Cryptobacterium curtum TaxID=84163 RepID=UPI00248DC962|nr:ABC transporter permease [Cryptobacterium curtum]